MRTIDADELKEQIRRHLGVKSLEYLLPAEKAIVDQIDNMPTINTEKKHSKWVKKTEERDGYVSFWYECLECGQKPLKQYDSDVYSSFCPNCGLRMINE